MLKATVIFNNRTPEFEGDAAKFVTKAVGKSAKLMERNVKIETPVKHGYLRRSISSNMTGQFSGEVFTNPISEITKITSKGSKKKKTVSRKEVSYAVYVEYGTRYMAPRAMFRKGVGKSEKGIKQIFADEAKAEISKFK
jgi:HK97 gp10 family phage protein